MFNPALLKLAREAAALPQTALATATGVSQPLISQFENGDRTPEARQLEALAGVLDRPVSFFAQTDEITRGGISDFYHRKRTTVPKKALWQTHAEANILRMQISRLLEKVEFTTDLPLPAFDPDEFDAPEEIAAAVRAAWRMPVGPVRNLVEALENAGVLIVVRPFATAKLDAVTQWYRTTPVVVLNAAFPASRMRWTLAHELGHLVMHQTPTDPTRAEIDADRFAAGFLMPAEDILPHFGSGRITIERAVNLKQHWRTSIAAIARRANDLGALTDRQLRSFFMRRNQLGYTKNEPGEFPKEEPTLLQRLVTALTSAGWSTSQVAALIHATEQDVRTTYLNRAATRLRVL